MKHALLLVMLGIPSLGWAYTEPAPLILPGVSIDSSTPLCGSVQHPHEWIVIEWKEWKEEMVHFRARAGGPLSFVDVTHREAVLLMCSHCGKKRKP